MKKYLAILLFAGATSLTSWQLAISDSIQAAHYQGSIDRLKLELLDLQKRINNNEEKSKIISQLNDTRLALKRADFWLRYTNPIAYKFLNGPLPVEWEVEVFEKWEKPYRRNAAGLTLLQIAMDKEASQQELQRLVSLALDSITVFQSPRVLDQINTPATFYFANRLHLLNLATIYTTGFECPDTDGTIPELEAMLEATLGHYRTFSKGNKDYSLHSDYIAKYEQMMTFVQNQPKQIETFDHYHFVKDYVNLLFTLNQQRIQELNLTSSNVNDYSLSNEALSIFDKSLYKGLENKGVFKGLKSRKDLDQLYTLGEQLFNDPLLSINNKRSCASCHKPSQFFNDTNIITSLQLDKETRLPRNTPSLVGSLKNHLLMLDGRHISAENQADEVTQNPLEMGLGPKEILPKVLSIKEYKKSLSRLASKTINDEVSAEHIYSAIIFYYSSLDTASAPLDRAMNGEEQLSVKAIKGFNLFMSKAECATCHFAPQFNGVKPPYVSSEFEVVGTPQDTGYADLSSDLGRGKVHDVPEMQNAFRTPTLRNLSYTKPYMHNGVFQTIDEVLEFYNTGGGAGNRLSVPNQTLNENDLNLSKAELSAMKAFLLSLDENIQLPNSTITPPKGKGELKHRKTTY